MRFKHPVAWVFEWVYVLQNATGNVTRSRPRIKSELQFNSGHLLNIPFHLLISVNSVNSIVTNSLYIKRCRSD